MAVAGVDDRPKGEYDFKGKNAIPGFRETFTWLNEYNEHQLTRVTTHTETNGVLSIRTILGCRRYSSFPLILYCTICTTYCNLDNGRLYRWESPSPSNRPKNYSVWPISGQYYGEWGVNRYYLTQAPQNKRPTHGFHMTHTHVCLAILGFVLFYVPVFLQILLCKMSNVHANLVSG